MLASFLFETHAAPLLVHAVIKKKGFLSVENKSEVARLVTSEPREDTSQRCFHPNFFKKSVTHLTL